jgi:hypothetical protein
MLTHEAKETRFHYNSDFGGSICCINKETGQSLEISSTDLLDFVAQRYVAAKKIEKIEAATTDEILLG